MAKISILITLLLQLCTMVPGLFPCYEYHTDIAKPGTSEILGQIVIPSPPKNGPFHLRVGLNTNPLFHTKQPVARLELARSKEESVKAVQEGEPLLYHLHYAAGQPIPRVTKIWFNDRQYCPNPGEVENIITTSELSHLYNPNEPPSFISQLNSSSHEYSNTLIPSRFDTDTFPNNINNNECGISTYTQSSLTNILVAGGLKTKPGKWPWLVALFAVMRDHEFRCAGSILTTKHIITAAHCLKLNRLSNDTIHPNVLLVALGRFNLREWRETGTETREVKSYKIHPEFAHTDSGDSDIAILVLRTSVDYSPVIKPICLWTGSINLENIIGKTGIVVGWGIDESGNYTTEPRMVRVPIVSQEVCLRSHQAFFLLTSGRTFCAGLRDQTGPCNGDSGSGLVLLDSTGRYQLRGIVSRGVVKQIGQEKFVCDLREYVVYLDVAKYLLWIQEQISTT